MDVVCRSLFQMRSFLLLLFAVLNLNHVIALDESALNPRIIDSIKKNIKWENIRDNLRNFTSELHLAGTPGNDRLAEKIADKWRTAGLEDVRFIEYEVLLSYPDFSNPNRMTILSPQNAEIYKSKGRSRYALDHEKISAGADVQWNAYSDNGTVVGDVVYCHYGRKEDFKVLEENGIDLKGKIALIRYGNGYRGNKIRKAQRKGAIGAILYSDPAEVASDGTNPSDVFPSKKWMPSEGVQRGAVRSMKGDSLSPLYPAKKDLYDLMSIEEAKEKVELPSIPVMPLSYSDAWQILSRMRGVEVPVEWRGGLNVTYRLGAGLENGGKVKMDVKSTLEKRTIKNVIGYITGSEEPDKYVMLGNHFDAWSYGAIDPNSGTAVLAEVARAFVAAMKEQNWRPKRTIVFCNWDGEEFGLIGSTEFVEEFATILRDRAIVYLNVDSIHANETLYVSTIPTMYEIAYKTSKLVENPMESEKTLGRSTVYDTWLDAYSNEFKSLPEAPAMPLPRGNSDHASFLNFLGLPVAHISYSNRDGYGYPLYHSMYETPFLNEHIFDTNNLSVHRAVGEYLALLTYQFADLPTVPLNITVFSEIVATEYVPSLKQKLEDLMVDFSELKDAWNQVKHLEKDAEALHNAALAFEASEILISQKNSRIMTLHYCFVNPRGIPGRPSFRHLLYSIDDSNTHSTLAMTAIFRQMSDFMTAKTAEERQMKGRKVAEQISILQVAVQCAASSLSAFI